MSVTAAAQQPHTFQVHDHWSADLGTESARAASPKTAELGMFAEEEPSFWDFLDVINPLQHIPVINTLYREITGDQIGIGARLAGGALFGGPVGFAAAVVNTAVEQDTGKDIGGHVLALFDGDEAPTPEDPGTKVALEPAPPAPTAMAAVTPVAAPEAMATPSTMIFSADGAPPPAVEKAVLAADAPPRPLRLAPGQEPRFFPAPPRAQGMEIRNPPPPVSVPISNSGNRSNVPITGRDPVASTGPSPLAIQKALADQGHPNARHPMVPDVADAEWFGSAMKSGLDKYQQAAKLGRGTGTADLIPLQ